MSKNYVSGKVVLITGAGSGFGKITANLAAEMGAKVVIGDVNEAAVMATAAEINAKGGVALGVVCDVTKRDQVNAFAQAAIAKFGEIDVLVNNAGIMPLAFFADHEKAWKAWDLCFDVNLKGVIYGISAVYDQMIKQGRGQVINISSIYGNHPVEGSAVYQATKVGVRFISETLRVECQGKIKVSCLSPTGVGGTNLGSAIVNFEALKGAVGTRWDEYMKDSALMAEGKGDPDWGNIDSIKYMGLDPESLSKNIIYCINQPWGVSIGNILVRSSGEYWFL